jgi:hypothetical protein
MQNEPIGARGTSSVVGGGLWMTLSTWIILVLTGSANAFRL